MTKQEAIKYGKTQLDIFGGKHAEFIKLAIEALENDNKSKWILTSEELPKNEEKVLYATKDGMIYSGIYYDKDSLSYEWCEIGNFFDNDDDVIAWRPYKQEGKE